MLLTRWWRVRVHAPEDGQTMAEYSVCLALIVIACMVTLTALSGGIGATLTQITGVLTAP
jgi:Flp pilus assembly pilin Flp